MVNLSMTPGPAGRRGPRREAVADDLNPMEMWTSDTGCLSATSHTMWNGRHSKTWWKIKVGSPVMDEILTYFLHCYGRGCRFSGHFDWLLQIWRHRGFQRFFVMVKLEAVELIKKKIYIYIYKKKQIGFSLNLRYPPIVYMDFGRTCWRKADLVSLKRKLYPLNCWWEFHGLESSMGFALYFW